MPVDDFRVAQYSQSQTFPTQIQQAYAQGLCVGLCAKWLRVRSLHMDSGAGGATRRLGHLIDANVGDTALARMNEAHGRPDPNRDIVRAYGLDRDGMVNVACGLDVLIRHIVAARRRMTLFTVTCPRYGNGNHALAAYLSRGDRVHFYDPNEGEYIVSNRRFGRFITDFLDEKYQAASEHICEVFAVRAN